MLTFTLPAFQTNVIMLGLGPIINNSLTMLRVPAPAKINLFLHVLSKRADGYHNLQTAFQFIDLIDELSFTTTTDSHHCEIHGCGDIPLEQNLIYRAATKIRPFASKATGLKIQVNKQIPLGAGLGGGSSNAASTLMALNQLWQCDLALSQLMALATSLGADVPIFILGQAAWGEGIGTELTPIHIPCAPYLIINPNVHVDTAQVFRNFRLTDRTPPFKICDYQLGSGQNDLERAATSLYPAIEHIMALYHPEHDVRMTGSGSSVFIKVANAAEAKQLAKRLPASCKWWFVTSLNRSPLHEALVQNIGV